MKTMICLDTRSEISRIGALNAKELHELACYVAAKNASDNARYILQCLIDEALQSPDKRVFQYVQERTQGER